MAGLDAQNAQDGAVEALGGREVRDGDADVVEHPAEATVAGMLDVRKADVRVSLLGAVRTVGRSIHGLEHVGRADAAARLLRSIDTTRVRDRRGSRGRIRPTSGAPAASIGLLAKAGSPRFSATPCG